jgi:hypothetical protein
MQKPVMLLRALTLFPLFTPLAQAALADLIVLDQDCVEVPAAQIRTICPQLTTLEGGIVYARAPFKP